MAFFLNLLCILLFAQMVNSIGFSQFFANLAIRGTLYAETTMLNALASAAVTFSSITLACAAVSSRRHKLGMLACGLTLIVLSILLAARAALIEFLFIFMCVRSQAGFAIRLNFKVIAVAAMSIFVLVEVAYLTRITAETDQRGGIGRVFLTEQIPQSENAVIHLQNPRSGFEFSVAQAAIAWVPRALLEALKIEKGDGANAEFTAQNFPHRWFDQNSQLSLGGINEVIIGLGGMGACVFLFLWSRTLSWIYEWVQRSPALSLFGIPLVWSIFQFLRGDLFHTVNKAAISVFVLLALVALVGRHKLRVRWHGY